MKSRELMESWADGAIDRTLLRIILVTLLDIRDILIQSSNEDKERKER